MRNAGAARRRREPEPEPPDPVAAAVAELGRVVAASDATRRRLERHDQAVTGIIAGMEALAAVPCPDAGRLAAAADRLSEWYATMTVELIALAARGYEGREALERLEPRLAAIAMMRDAWIAEGRRREREAAGQAAQVPAPGPRHARRRHLNPVPGIGSAAGRATLAAGVALATLGGGIAAMHEESAVRTVASVPAPSRGVHRMPPDTAVLLPSPVLPSRAYQPKHAKPGADAAAATPAPSPPAPVLVSPSPSVPSAPPSPVSSGTVNLQTLRVVVGPSGQARIVFTASGTVQWSASASGPVVLNRYGGLLGDGQPAVITVTVQGGGTGSAVVTITDQDGNATQVPVTWVALPVL